jgi:hypothetical protein
VDLVVLELSDVDVLVVDEEASFSVLYAIHIKSLVLAGIGLSLRTEAVRLIMGPFPLVPSPVRVDIITEAVCLVGNPVALI